MKKAFFFEKLEQKKVRCQACCHFCLIESHKKGICGVRINQGGKLFLLVYGKVAALNIDPIEKKPLFHFLPKTKTLSLGTLGCNFSCLNCQNFGISQWGKKEFISFKDSYKEKELNHLIELNPKQVVVIAEKENCPSISFTYNEPTIWVEYVLEVMKIAKKKGIKNIWVSNGFMSKEVLERIIPFLDAINVDIKSSEEEFYQKICKAKISPILENCKILVQSKVWLEITTLIIPSFTDKKEIIKKIATFIKNELGKNTPWHLSAFSGKISYRMKNVADTSFDKIKEAFQIAKEIGLEYVYGGNTFNLKLESTFCPQCNELLIKRRGYQVERFDQNGICKKCGFPLPGIW